MGGNSSIREHQIHPGPVAPEECAVLWGQQSGKIHVGSWEGSSYGGWHVCVPDPERQRQLYLWLAGSTHRECSKQNTGKLKEPPQFCIVYDKNINLHDYKQIHCMVFI